MIILDEVFKVTKKLFFKAILRNLFKGVILFMVSITNGGFCTAIDGHAQKDTVLVGFHYGDIYNHEGRMTKDYPLNIWPFFDDYLEYMQDDMLKTSYVDFWRWWYILERYKGDEKGMTELDKMVDKCLERGMKVKMCLGWSTWWTQDKDWAEGQRLNLAPGDLDDWIHWCYTMSRRFKGRVVLWDLVGESNSLENCWPPGTTMEHVHDAFKLGYRACKLADPDLLIGASDASPSAPQDEMDKWYESNIKGAKGYYDSISINFFADVADPYKGGVNYYNSIRRMLDDVGAKDVEIGMGETSIQWAETTVTAAIDKLSMEKQAIGVNKTFGELMDIGMNKLITWSTEFAPGGGHWPWRWGFRNYEDWWGIWPETHKIPGTRIVYRYDAPDGNIYDLRPEWPRPTDPYYPAWEIYCFWAQCTPPKSESIRLTMNASKLNGIFWKISTFLSTFNECVSLLYNEESAPINLTIDSTKTGWHDGTSLKVDVLNEDIDFKTGFHTNKLENLIDAKVKDNKIEIDLPAISGFTTLKIIPNNPELDAEFVGQVFHPQTEVGQDIQGHMIVRNKGRNEWKKGHIILSIYPENKDLKNWELLVNVSPNEESAFSIKLPPQETPGNVSYKLRLRDSKHHWFGPVFSATTKIVDSTIPRKLVAHREIEHTRLKWFAPENSADVKSYEIYRADGFDKPFNLLTTCSTTEYIDKDLNMDKVYYYRVIAVNVNGNKSRTSNEDNARAISKPRIYDAEIISHNVPEKVRIGDPYTVSITIRNTGSKKWDLRYPDRLAYWFQPTQLWGVQDEKKLPKIVIDKLEVKPGEDVTVEFPFIGPKTGRFENHWVMWMEVPDSLKKNTKGNEWGWTDKVQHAYFGTPLLFETTVVEK